MESRKTVLITYLQGSNKDADIENRPVDTAGGGEGGMSWESSVETYVTIRTTASQCKCVVAAGSLTQLCDNLEWWGGVGDAREVQEVADTCTPMADSCWYMVETNTTL